MALCFLCDTIFDENDENELLIHQHQEPQSGPYRDKWLKSGLPYGEWVETTNDGKAWEAEFDKIRERK